MNSTTTATTAIINDLIEICKDGQDGFDDASEIIKQSDLTTLLSGYSLQRTKFAGELQQLVIGLGEEPETSSCIPNAMHRGWIDLKGVFTKGGEYAILAECERGEDRATGAYRDALKKEMPTNIRENISAQCAAVQAAHHDIRDRRDACAE